MDAINMLLYSAAALPAPQRSFLLASECRDESRRGGGGGCAVTLAQRLQEWKGARVSVLFSNEETQFGDLLEVGDDYIMLMVGSLQYLINLHSIMRINQVREQ